MAEDSAEYRGLLRYFLQPWRLELTETSAVAEASQLAGARAFDLYIIDLQLIDGDSIAVLDDLGRRGLTAKCVVLTAFPRVARAFTDIPVVDKSRLNLLGEHLVRILGQPLRGKEM